MSRRNYGQFCGLARALDVVGERWTLLLVREFLLGPRRYGELLTSLPGLTTNLLASRLKQLEDAGIVVKRQDKQRGAAVYALTDRGRELEPAIMALGRWGEGLLDSVAPGDRVDIAWGLISMKRRFQGGRGLRILIEADDRDFTLSFQGDYLEVEERRTDAADVHLIAKTPALQRLLFRGESLAALEAASAIEVHGTTRAQARFLKAFGLK